VCFLQDFIELIYSPVNIDININNRDAVGLSLKVGDKSEQEDTDWSRYVHSKSHVLSKNRYVLKSPPIQRTILPKIQVEIGRFIHASM
jgi:hypothetical protein